MATGQSIVTISPAMAAANKEAADYFTGGSDAKVDAKGVQKHSRTLQAAIRAGMKLLPFAMEYGATSKTRTGRLVAHGALGRRWRHADYIVKATGHDDIVATLETGYTMTSADVAKLCSQEKPAMVEAGILKDTGRKAETIEERQAAWEKRAVKRIEDATKQGVKATTGATSDVPAWDAVSGVFAKLGNILKLRAAADKAGKPRATRKHAPAPHGESTDDVPVIEVPAAVNQ